MTRSSDNTNYFKGYFNLPPGIADVGSYQVSGLPFINRGAVAANAGGDTTISFPSVTKSLTIINKDAENDEIRVHFGSTANDAITNGNYITLDSKNSSLTINVKCKEVFLSTPSGGGAADYEMFAELTGIDTAQMININVADWPGVTS